MKMGRCDGNSSAVDHVLSTGSARRSEFFCDLAFPSVMRSTLLALDQDTRSLQRFVLQFMLAPFASHG